jgi:uncharacterized protein YneF (UPF0154 family)
MRILDCIDGADAMFHALLIVIGILIGVMAELYVVKHQLEKKDKP